MTGPDPAAGTSTTAPTRLLGACRRVLGEHGSPHESLRTAAGLGLSLVEFASPFDIAADLAPGAFRTLADAGRALGVQVACALGMLSPGHPDRTRRYRDAGGGDLLTGLHKAVAAIAELGTGHVQVVVGTLDDRHDPRNDWAGQLQATADLYTALRPVLSDLGLALAIKTHEEITSHEILTLIDTVGADVLAVALDPVNLPVRGEDPVLATERLAAHVARVHYDDAWITFTGRGLARRLCPAGEGDIDWPAIFRALDRADRTAPVLIDLHRAEFEIPVRDEHWLLHNGDISLREVSILSANARPDREPVMATAPRLRAALTQLLPQRATP
ncbi:sugar phosphate isomerase/epimerase family protein [Rhodococcus sp. NPDC057529]|uniref:sugar phosphate isomerase/epimerase family protein n=1 Tax=Rhodococcus sp. NPDC057529 TaxID=3346158 RepID=UPI00366D147B